MPVTGSRHKIKAYTIEASGTPVATIKAAGIPDAMRYIIGDFFEEINGNGWWNDEEPIAIRCANWLEKDALLAETKADHRGDGDDEHFVYWHTRESTSNEEASHKARSQRAA